MNKGVSREISNQRDDFKCMDKKGLGEQPAWLDWQNQSVLFSSFTSLQIKNKLECIIQQCDLNW